MEMNAQQHSKTEETADNFHRLGKHFSFRQLLNSFDRIGNNYVIWFLSTTTGILFKSVDLKKKSLILSLETSGAKI